MMDSNDCGSGGGRLGPAQATSGSPRRDCSEVHPEAPGGPGSIPGSHIAIRTAALREAAAVCRERAMLHRRAFSEAPARAMERLAGREEEATNCANLIERLIDAGDVRDTAP